MEKKAVISSDGMYRYKLTRMWSHAPLLGFVMLNPSTADATDDDPTIRRCIGFAQREKFGGILVTNLCAFRATDPQDLLKAADPVGSLNYTHVRKALAVCPLTVAGWGSNYDRLKHVPEVVRIASMVRENFNARHLGALTRTGQPRHPLYLSKALPMVAFY